jgi:intracellular multiplication protein IcmO
MAAITDKRTRGLDASQERRQNSVRDSRSFLERQLQAMEKPDRLFTAFGALALASAIVPGVPLVVWGAAAYGLYRFGMSRKGTLPLRLPIMARRSDWNSKKGGKPAQAGGIVLLGYDVQTGQQIWINNSDARQHFLYLATTGGGKTEALISLVSNSLAWGSGFCFVDGKADTSLYAKLYSMARRFGREDDVRVVNYLTGGKDEKIESNTMNPFASGSSSELTELLISLMDGAGGTNGDVWKGRAISLISAVIRALTYMRDGTGLDLSVSIIREHLTLPKVIEIAKRTDLPRKALDGLKAYLESLPGYKPNMAPDKIPNDTNVQHGYLQMQFTRVLGELADTYGKIFGPKISDIDMFDIVANRRILIVMLPALEKSEDALRQLGKIIIAMTKIMMSKALGSTIVGESVEIIENKPTTAQSPFFVVLDECGYYLSPDAALMAAQARSLGFSLVFATQDIPSLKAGLKEKADSVMGNTSCKLIGKLEDPRETLEYAAKRAGRAETLKQTSFESRHTFASKEFYRKDDASVQEVDRVNALDIYAQEEGEYHLFFYDKVLRMKSFYANPPVAAYLNMNVMVPLAPPEPGAMTAMDHELEKVVAALRNPVSLKVDPAEFSPEMMMLAHCFRCQESLGVVERSCGGLAAMGALDRGIEMPAKFAEIRDIQLARFAEMNEEIDGAQAIGSSVSADIDFDDEAPYDEEDDGFAGAVGGFAGAASGTPGAASAPDGDGFIRAPSIQFGKPSSMVSPAMRRQIALATARKAQESSPPSSEEEGEQDAGSPSSAYAGLAPPSPLPDTSPLPGVILPGTVDEAHAEENRVTQPGASSEDIFLEGAAEAPRNVTTPEIGSDLEDLMTARPARDADDSPMLAAVHEANLEKSPATRKAEIEAAELQASAVAQLAAIEEAVGATPEEARQAAESVAKELREATLYPTSPIVERPSVDAIRKSLREGNALVRNLVNRPNRRSSTKQDDDSGDGDQK